MNSIINHRQNHKEEICLADSWTSAELEACVQLLVLLFIPCVTPAKPISSTLCFNFPVYDKERMQPFTPPKLLIIHFRSDCKILRSQSENIKVPKKFTALITKLIHNFVIISNTRRPFFPVLSNIKNIKSQLLSSLTMSQQQLRGCFPRFISTYAPFSLFSLFFIGFFFHCSY